MPPSRIIVPKTPDHGDEAVSSKEDEDKTLIERGSNQGLQVPKLKVGGKTIRTPQKASGSIASDASSKGSRESRTRGDSAQIAEGIPLEEKFSKKQAKKGAGQGRADPQRRFSAHRKCRSKEIRKGSQSSQNSG
jgi:hypothetical protein